MHRHGYKGAKFGREKDQRQALIKSLAESLIIHESIKTTLPKAKELIPFVEKLITKAKKGDLASRRAIISSLATKESAHKLVDELAPRYADRSSGHLSLSRNGTRRGDNAELATVSFIAVDKKTGKTNTSNSDKKTTTEQSAKEKHHEATKVQPSSGKISSKTSAHTVAKRSGVRGNR